MIALTVFQVLLFAYLVGAVVSFMYILTNIRLGGHIARDIENDDMSTATYITIGAMVGLWFIVLPALIMFGSPGK